MGRTRSQCRPQSQSITRANCFAPYVSNFIRRPKSSLSSKKRTAPHRNTGNNDNGRRREGAHKIKLPLPGDSSLIIPRGENHFTLSLSLSLPQNPIAHCHCRSVARRAWVDGGWVVVIVVVIFGHYVSQMQFLVSDLAGAEAFYETF